MKILVLAVLTTAFMATGCTRKQHLTEWYGQSFDAAFATQRAPARQGEPQPPVSGLDSQEAAIISDSYRNSLARKSEQVKEEPVLIVAPSRDGRPQQLLPSVPKQ